MKQIKTAVLIESLDPLFFKPVDKKSCFLTVPGDGLLANLARQNFSARQIIVYNPGAKKKNPLGSLVQTDLLRQWRSYGINHFVIPHSFKKEYPAWARKNGLQLVGPTARHKKLENKIYFDNLLKKFDLPSPPTIGPKDLIGQKAAKGWVAQEPESYGMFGTKFIKTWPALKKLFSENRSGRELLVRQYLPGIPLGVGIFMDRFGAYFFTALRRQCFQYEQGWPKHFLGIQWLSKGFFTAAASRRIAEVLMKLAKALAREGFYGLANIDLLIYKNQPFIIECNPRLSSATPQIFSVPGLTNHPRPWQFYLNTYYGLPNSKIRARVLPFSKFQGCLLDVDLTEPKKPKRILVPGVYGWRNNRLVFFGDSVRAYQNDKNSLFLFHELSSRAGVLPAGTTLATVISQQPLFNLKTGGLNAKGLKIFNYIKKEYLN